MQNLIFQQVSVVEYTGFSLTWSEPQRQIFLYCDLISVNIFVDKMRDFTDMLILARHEAESDPEEQDLDKLTDTHIIQTLSDIFFGKCTVV